ncbi:hypothetical protein C8J57DRAFT_1523364 [Mycena rebaudengoi]|nr:hypothetical protein C8J57DRAFT_1523364 [Mycena rebaudengoi]
MALSYCSAILTLGPGQLYKCAPTTFLPAHTLTTVHLSVNNVPSRFQLPWSQLTTVSVVFCDLSEVAHILRHAVSLVEFRGSLGCADAIQDIPPLLHLQSFILLEETCGYAPDAQKLLLDAITAPALQHLTVSQRELQDNLCPTIAFLISRSHCNLDSLHVTNSLHYNLHKMGLHAALPTIRVIENTEDVRMRL